MSSESENGGGTRRIAPVKLSHAVLRTTRLKEMVEWYKTVLNAEVMYQNDFLVFMTYDEEHHRMDGRTAEMRRQEELAAGEVGESRATHAPPR